MEHCEAKGGHCRGHCQGPRAEAKGCQGARGRGAKGKGQGQGQGPRAANKQGAGAIAKGQGTRGGFEPRQGSADLRVRDLCSPAAKGKSCHLWEGCQSPKAPQPKKEAKKQQKN